MGRWAGLLGFVLTCSLLASIESATAQPPEEPPCGAPFVTIEQPPNDIICAEGLVEFRGRCLPMQRIQLQLGNDLLSVTANADGAWVLNSAVAGAPEPTRMRVVASTDGVEPQEISVWVTRQTPRPLQRVQFHWESGALGAIVQIAAKTLKPPPAQQELTRFRDTVPFRTEGYFFSMLSAWNIQPAEAEGDDVFTVEMVDFQNGRLLGFTPNGIDTWNQSLNDTSEVYVPRVSESMIHEFHFWKPMRHSDEFNVRVDDVSIVLARIAVHEFGHAVGLVAEQWMSGCEGGHNCPTGAFPRFGRGWEIMDPGDASFTPPFVRLGETSADTRSPTRRFPDFNPFNRSYLSLLHPHP